LIITHSIKNERQSALIDTVLGDSDLLGDLQKYFSETAIK